MEQDPTFPTDGPTDGHDSMLYEAPLAPNTCCKGTKWECPGENPKDCANTRCEKKIHDICYRHFVYNKLEERTELVSPHTNEHLVVCSRTPPSRLLQAVGGDICKTLNFFADECMYNCHNNKGRHMALMS